MSECATLRDNTGGSAAVVFSTKEQALMLREDLKAGDQDLEAGDQAGEVRRDPGEMLREISELQAGVSQQSK